MPAADRFLPDLNRISVLAAAILLAYALTGVIDLPARPFSAQLPGFYFEVQFNIQVIVTLLVTALAVSGADWLLREHPSAQGKPHPSHWLLPALTAWVIGIPLYQGVLGPYGWLGILLGGSALILVLVAEFIVIEPQDARYQLATIVLNGVSYTLFFLLAVSLRFNQLRLFLIVPALGAGIALISFRTLTLRLPGQSVFQGAVICGVLLAQIAAAAHYLPLTPIGYGFFLLGPAYGVSVWVGNLAEGQAPKQAALEPLLVLLCFWGLALWVGK